VDISDFLPSASIDDTSDGISDEEFTARREVVGEAVGAAGLAALIGFGDCWRAANVCYFTPFRPLDGVSDIANSVVLIEAGGKATLFVSAQCADDASEMTTFPVRPLTELVDALSEFALDHRGATVGLGGSYYIPASILDRLHGGLHGLTLESSAVLAEIKAVKSDAEVGLLRKAARLTDAAMAAIHGLLSDGRPHSEREMSHVADMAMLAGGADRTGYDSMVHSGHRAGYNLARPTDRIVQPGELVMTDIGARYRGYVADGGRGFAVGEVDAQKRAMIESAADAVEAGLAAAKPGMVASELNAVIQADLVRSGFEEYSSEARGHGTGHGTGMDPEEEAPWIGPGNDTVLRENMVFTMKATITVPGVGGLRTEHIVRLASDGIETLDNFPLRLYW
jgi:Xaa-Pro aminopeptidase